MPAEAPPERRAAHRLPGAPGSCRSALLSPSRALPFPPGHFSPSPLKVRAERGADRPATALALRLRPGAPALAHRRSWEARALHAARRRARLPDGWRGRAGLSCPGRALVSGPGRTGTGGGALPRGGNGVKAAWPRPRAAHRPISERGGQRRCRSPARPGAARGMARGGRAMGPAARGGGTGGGPGRGLPCARPAGARALSRG